jgi:outer membrane protein assembly factor BamA
MDGRALTMRRRVDRSNARRSAGRSRWPALLGLLACLAVPAWPSRTPAQGPSALAPQARVKDVELVLPEGDDRAAAAALLTLRAGDPVSTLALRATVQRLYQTGRYRNVVIRARPAAAPAGDTGEWVSLTVEAEAQRRIARVSVRSVGPSALPEDALRSAARLNPGDPFDDADLEAATARVRVTLARKGYRQPRIDAAVRGGNSVSVDLSVECGPPPRVRAVRAQGDAGRASGALARLTSRPGAVLDLDQLEEDARSLRAALHADGFRRVRVAAPEVEEQGGEAVVTFPVTLGPRMELVFRGNAALSRDALERQMGLDPELPLDVNALDAAVERLRTFYRAHGYAAARVEVEEVPRGNELAVVFRIAEGSRYRLAEVRFEGSQDHPPSWLRARMLAHMAEDQPVSDSHEADAVRLVAASFPGVRARPVGPPSLPVGEYYDEASWERAADATAEDLRGEGYLESISLGTSAALDAMRRTVEVVVRFREGPRTTVESVRFEGNRALSLDDLEPQPRLAPGDPLVWARVEEIRTAVLRRYASRGRIFARLDTEVQMDGERHTAAVRYRIEEGPEVHVGRILITGSRRTRPDLIRGNVELREGALFDPEAAARSQTALLDTGVFRSVSLRLQDPDLPQESKDVTIDVVERPYASLTQALGFSIANGPRATLEYVRPNVLGRALELSVRGKINYPTNAFNTRPDLVGRSPSDRVEGQFDVGLRTARLPLLPFRAGGRTNVIGEVVHRPAYNLKRVSWANGLDVGVTSRATFSLQYEVEVDSIDRTGAVGPLTQVDVERLRFDEGTTTLHALRPSFALDHRDNSAHPQRGWLVSGWVEYEHSLGGPGRDKVLGLLPHSDIHTNLLKASALLSGYVPLGGHAVLALSARAGQVFPLDSRSRTVIPRRFFLGGASTLRGFAEEELIEQDVRPQLAREARACATSLTGQGCTDRGRRIAGGETPVSEGGEAFLLGKVELRLPVSGRFELGLFFDAGNLWLDPQLVDARKLRPCAGVGARFVTPIGPAALDLGFNLDRDRDINEAVFAPHFTIGLF